MAQRRAKQGADPAEALGGWGRREARRKLGIRGGGEAEGGGACRKAARVEVVAAKETRKSHVEAAVSALGNEPATLVVTS
jgi:hypothetical protein